MLREGGRRCLRHVAICRRVVPPRPYEFRHRTRQQLCEDDRLRVRTFARRPGFIGPDTQFLAPGRPAHCLPLLATGPHQDLGEDTHACGRCWQDGPCRSGVPDRRLPNHQPSELTFTTAATANRLFPSNRAAHLHRLVAPAAGLIIFGHSWSSLPICNAKVLGRQLPTRVRL